VLHKGICQEFDGVIAEYSAHLQNDIAERAIQTIAKLAWLLHSNLYCPKCSDLELWPIALDYEVSLEPYAQHLSLTALIDLFTGGIKPPSYDPLILS